MSAPISLLHRTLLFSFYIDGEGNHVLSSSSSIHRHLYAGYIKLVKVTENCPRKLGTD